MAKRRDLRVEPLANTELLERFVVLSAPSSPETSQNMPNHPMYLSTTGREYLKPIKTFQTNDGTTTIRYQQYYAGLPLWREQVIVRQNQDKHTPHLYGTLMEQLDEDNINVRPSLSNEQAFSIVLSSISAGDEPKPNILRQDFELYIYIDVNEKTYLVYEVSLSIQHPTTKDISSPIFIIDANTGDILENFNNIQSFANSSDIVATYHPDEQNTKYPTNFINKGLAAGPGGNLKTGRYMYGRDKPSLKVMASDDGQSALINEHVITINLNHGSESSTPFIFEGSENTHKEINGAYCPINDAHQFGSVVFSMYKDWCQTRVLDSELKLCVHYLNEYENAIWNPQTQTMSFGDGDKLFYPLVSLDVVAHEASHGFTQQHSGLLYRGESGAINESFSDIAGEAAEYYLRGSADFCVGADIFKAPGKAMRYMKRPSQDGKSIEHLSEYNDNLDVHHSSGLFNRVFYLLAAEKMWGIKKTFKTFAFANMHFWIPRSTFAHAGAGLCEAAKELHFSGHDVAWALNKVGIELDI